MGKPSLQRRVAGVAETVLGEQRYVSFVDIVTGIGWIHPVNVDAWRKGRLTTLEELLAVPVDRLVQAAHYLTAWAQAQGLRPEEVDYVTGRERRQLTFLAGTTPDDERALRTHWFAADYAPAEREQVVERRAPELVAVIPVRDWTCSSCGDTGEFLFMENDQPLCLDCADLGHLVFLPSGDAALTRRARKASGLALVVVRWARARKRYERQGILVEESALAEAEQHCLADVEARGRRRARDAERRAVQDLGFQAAMAAEIRKLFPPCPASRAEAIARHAGTLGSGRVGRSAAGRALDARAVTLAVVASVRHTDTDYDTLLMAGVPRAEARTRVAADIDRVLAGWGG